MSNKKILFLLDESGSMGSVREITVGGFNAWKRTLELVENDVRVTVVAFNYSVRTLYEDVPVRKIPDMTVDDYRPQNFTRLYDALIAEANKLKSGMAKDDTALVIILTDGEDSHSGTTTDRISEYVAELYKNKWSILYLSSDDRYLEHSAMMGIPRKNVVYFHASTQGTEEAYQEVTRASMSFVNDQEEELETWKPVFEQQLEEVTHEQA